MALGASSRKVAQLILSQTTRPVLYGLLVGVGLATSLATVLIATPAGTTIAQSCTSPTRCISGEPPRERDGVPARRMDPRDTGRKSRSDADDQAGVITCVR